MTDIKRRGDPRALSCNDGHDLCYCAGRPECHNCGQPLWDDYVKEPLDHSDYSYNHAACCDLVLSHFTYDDWEIGTDEKCAQSETPEIEVGDRVAFKHGDEPIEALCGDVIAIKGSEAVVEVKQLLGRQAFILPFDDLIVIPPKSQEQSND